MVGEPYQHLTWHTATSLATRLEQRNCFIDGLLMDDALDNEHYKISLSLFSFFEGELFPAKVALS
jgi:hypothetical protein